MARIHTILQGFVDINLETDENVNTKIIPTNQLQQAIGALNLNSGFVVLRKSLSVPDRVELPVPAEVLFEAIGINISSVQSAHIQGSRLYGVDNFDSDWDLAVISTDVVGHRFLEASIDGNEFDVHLYSKQEFQNRLNNHEMRELEFLSHPEKFFIINNKSFSVELDSDKLVNKVKLESDELWNRAKFILDSDGIQYVALKNIWHSFRFLIFAEQILKDGKITDFSAANYLYESIINSKQSNFEFFELNFSTLRDTLKLNLDTYKKDGGLEFIDLTV